MKLKIKVKRLNKNLPLPVVLGKADWIDLRASENHIFFSPKGGEMKTVEVNDKKIKYNNVKLDYYLMPLGVAIKLPDGYEAQVVARSSLPSGFGLIVANSVGIIDGGPLGYNGNSDEWKAPLIALRDTTVNEGERIVQFRVTLSQKATFWQKLKWLFYNGVKIVEVDDLGESSRGGFGTTGKV